MISENFLTNTAIISDLNINECPLFDKIKEGKYYVSLEDSYKNSNGYYIYADEERSELIDKFYSLLEKNLIEKAIHGCDKRGRRDYDRVYEGYDEYHTYHYNHYSYINLICEINGEYKKIYIQDLKSNKSPILIYKLSYILDLKPNTEYIISNFSKSENNLNGIITSEKCKYYVNKKVIDILEKYFKSEDDKIYCTYNNKEEIAKLTLVTEDEIITEDEIKMLHQSLKLEIGDKSFTFYINNHNLVNYKKEGKYCFLTMYIYDDLIFGNTIYGYEFKENKYYCLKNEEKLILNNINQEIAKNFRKMKNQDLYTYLLSNNEKYGMIINIDEYKNITYKLSKLNDKCFKSLLDISLLKPTNEWDKEFWDKEPCNINDIDDFNGVMEGFDDEEDEEESDEENNDDNNYREVDKFDSIDEEFDNE